MLAGLMLLGKLPQAVSDEMLYEVLDNVPRQALVKEDRSWRSCHWIWAALPVSLATRTLVTSR